MEVRASGEKACLAGFLEKCKRGIAGPMYGGQRTGENRQV